MLDQYLIISQFSLKVHYWPDHYFTCSHDSNRHQQEMSSWNDKDNVDTVLKIPCTDGKEKKMVPMISFVKF